MDRVFLDANVLFSAAYRKESGLRGLWELSGVELLSSGYAVEEARRNLNDGEQQKRLEDLLKHVAVSAEGAEVPLPDGLQLPEKDQPIFLAAAAAGATHLLTGDVSHFGRYYGQRFAGVRILPPGLYIREHEG